MNGDDAAITCPRCGSDHLEGEEHEYGTGVFAPDGGGERRLWVGFRCLECGEVSEVAS